MLVKKLVLLMLLLFLISGCGSGGLYEPGEVAVTGGRDGRVKVWNFNSGEVLHSIEAHTENVSNVRFSPCGSMVLSTGGEARIWDLEAEEGKEMTVEFGLHEESIRAAAFSSCGEKAVTSSPGKETGGIIMVWDIETAELIGQIETEKLVFELDVSSDGNKIIYPQAGVVNVCDSYGEPVMEFDAHPGSVTEWAANFSPSGEKAISGSRDNSALVWDPLTGEVLQEFNEHTQTVRAVSISPCGELAASGDWISIIHVWEIETGEIVVSFEEHEGRISSIDFSSCSEKLMSHSVSATALDKINPLVWDLGSGEVLLEFDEHADCVLSAEIFR